MIAKKEVEKSTSFLLNTMHEFINRLRAILPAGF